jgi:ribose transport system substrate-binding protein
MELRGMSFDGNKENLAAIAQDKLQAADIGYPLEWAGWASMDQLNRHFNDEELVEDHGIAFKLLTKENLPPDGAAFTGDLDYEAKYRELWGV